MRSSPEYWRSRRFGALVVLERRKGRACYVRALRKAPCSPSMPSVLHEAAIYDLATFEDGFDLVAGGEEDFWQLWTGVDGPALGWYCDPEDPLNGIWTDDKRRVSPLNLTEVHALVTQIPGFEGQAAVLPEARLFLLPEFT